MNRGREWGQLEARLGRVQLQVYTRRADLSAGFERDCRSRWILFFFTTHILLYSSQSCHWIILYLNLDILNSFGHESDAVSGSNLNRESETEATEKPVVNRKDKGIEYKAKAGEWRDLELIGNTGVSTREEWKMKGEEEIKRLSHMDQQNDTRARTKGIPSRSMNEEWCVWVSKTKALSLTLSEKSLIIL